MKVTKLAMTLVLGFLLITGCSSTDKKEGLAEGSADAALNASTSGYDGVSDLNASEMQGYGQGYGSNGSLMGGDFANPNSPLSKSTIYFKYDSSEVQDVFVSVIAAHSQYLASHPEQRIVLEGHADERGSPEYNIALGEQRAKSVFRMMEMQGVSRSQVELVSYGEEKPAEFGSDEAAWQQNRRVEIVYQPK
ncbi:MAG: peptidoglycan-associated lipoprotein Pal [Gammaproteobacteria bacterium]